MTRAFVSLLLFASACASSPSGRQRCTAGQRAQERLPSRFEIHEIMQRAAPRVAACDTDYGTVGTAIRFREDGSLAEAKATFDCHGCRAAKGHRKREVATCVERTLEQAGVRLSAFRSCTGDFRVLYPFRLGPQEKRPKGIPMPIMKRILDDEEARKKLEQGLLEEQRKKSAAE